MDCLLFKKNMYSFLFCKSWDGWLMSCLFMCGHHFFIVAVAILPLHGFPLFYVCLFSSIWIASIYVNTVSYILSGVSILCAWNICFDLTSNINWLYDLTNNISSLISPYQDHQFIKYCQKIVKKNRDTSPARNIAFSSIVLQKETRNINDSRGQISMTNFLIFASKRILILLIMKIWMNVI